MNYPITTPFGWVDGYPLNTDPSHPGQGFHKGIDYGYPLNTNVVVNGVVIGQSGATGTVTGPHLHVGKWSGGTVLDPGVGNGFSFNSAVVTEIHTVNDTENGKFVRIQGDNYSWVYLHLNSINVTVGQVLKGENMQQYNPNSGDLTNIHNSTGWPGHAPNANDIAYWCDGTGNPHYPKPNDVWTALTIEISNYQKSHATPGPKPVVLVPGDYHVN